MLKTVIHVYMTTSNIYIHKKNKVHVHEKQQLIDKKENNFVIIYP